jgi:hypothetical protein
VFNAESQERQHYTEKRQVKKMRMVAIEEKAGKKKILRKNRNICIIVQPASVVKWLVCSPRVQ